MNFKALLSYGLVLLVGLVLGAATRTGGKYQDGRLSACQDMLKVVMAVNPLIAMASPECVAYKDDAALKVGGKLYSLDGQTELKH